MSFEQMFQNGVNSFQSQEFEKASGFFSQALDLQPDNATVLVNLALTELKLGQKPAAYAHFKKALRIDPSFSVARQGFNYLETQFQVKQIPHRVEAYESLRQYLIEPFSVLVPLILSLSLLTWWGRSLFRFLGARKRAFLAGEDQPSYSPYQIALGLALLFTLFWTALFKFDSSIPRGIIQVESIPVRTSPLMTSPEVLQLFGGLEVRILRKQDSWTQVEYPGSIAGWIPATALLEL
jgi:tetratricopeptide (TPR) repeat protein